MTSNLAAQSGLAGLCLLAVLALILGAARLARFLPALSLAALNLPALNLPALNLRPPGAIPGPLTVTGSVALDRTRRLHLIDVAGSRALVLTSAGGDVMIELGQTR